MCIGVYGMAKGSKKKEKKGKASKEDSSGNVSIIIAIAVLVAIILFALNYKSGAPATDGTRVVATVNGVPITQADLDRQYALLPPQYKDAVTTDILLNQSLQEELLVQEAQAQGITVSDEEIDEMIEFITAQNSLTAEQLAEQLAEVNLTMDYLRDFYERKFLLTKLLNKTVISSIEVSAGEIEQYYEENQAVFESKESVEASHILVNTSEEAEAIIAELEAGADFAELAIEKSIGPSSVKGGQLGYFGRGEMVPTFEDAAFALEAGEISGPVKTQFGYHVIKVTDNVKEGILPLEKVSYLIEEEILNMKQAAVVKTYVKQLEAKAEIKIYEEGEGTEEAVAVEEISSEEEPEKEPVEVSEPEVPAEEIEEAEEEAAEPEPEPEEAAEETASGGSCAVGKGVKNGAVILVTADWCQSCNQMRDDVEALILQGGNFYIAEEGEDSSAVVEECYASVTGVPSLICTSDGSVKKGVLGSASMIAFSAECAS